MKKKILFVGGFIVIMFVGIIIYKTYLPKWTELSCGLWINNDGDIGLKVEAAINETKYVDSYITKIDDIPLKSVVDTSTFHYMGGSFYKDKNHIYNFYSTSDGGTFYPIDDRVDYSTFEILRDGYYARDKNHIYAERTVEIVEVADYETFRIIKGCLSQDKNSFIIWTDRITENEANEYLRIKNNNEK